MFSPELAMSSENEVWPWLGLLLKHVCASQSVNRIALCPAIRNTLSVFGPALHTWPLARHWPQGCNCECPMKRHPKKSHTPEEVRHAKRSSRTVSGVLLFPDLQAISGFSTKGRVEEWARANGIAFKYSHRGIWTTDEAVNIALGVQPSTSNEPYDPGVVI